MIVIAVLITLIFFIAIPVVAVRLFRSVKGKQKRLTRILIISLALLILLPGIFWRWIPGSDFLMTPYDNYFESRNNESLTGYAFSNGENIYSYDSSRDFNGDGYSIWIYELEPNAVKYFKKPDKQFFSSYPQKGIRSDWQVSNWKRTPMDSVDLEYLNFASHPLPSLNYELTDLINERGNYYAFRYNKVRFSESTLLFNIDFYIICPTRGIMVDINHNM